MVTPIKGTDLNRSGGILVLKLSEHRNNFSSCNNSFVNAKFMNQKFVSICMTSKTRLLSLVSIVSSSPAGTATISSGWRLAWKLMSAVLNKAVVSKMFSKPLRFRHFSLMFMQANLNVPGICFCMVCRTLSVDLRATLSFSFLNMKSLLRAKNGFTVHPLEMTWLKTINFWPRMIASSFKG